MMKRRMFSVATAFAFAGLVGCGGSDQEFETTDTEVFTQPGTETMEFEVPVEDTMLIERNVETQINVDTTELDRNRDDIPTPAPPQ